MSTTLPNGCGVALVTPFNSNGSQDLPGLRRMVDHVIDGGVDFIVVLGTTGEAITQSREECFTVMQTVHDHTAGRVPLVAGPFGGNSTAGVIERMQAYKHLLTLPGYVAMMSSVPSYVKPNQEGLYQHFMTLAEASPLPLLLYNVPGRTSVHMDAATTARLAAATENIIGVKEASGDMVEGMRLLRDCHPDFQVFSGDDPTALPSIAAGACGVISVVANAYPRLFTEMIHAALAGKFNLARRLNNHFLDLHPLLYCDGNPAGVKAVLAQLGLCTHTVHLPLTPVYESTRKRIVEQVLQLEAVQALGIA
jgi:4-hydroxy-tetrahydrodipicolinate synthase